MQRSLAPLFPILLSGPSARPNGLHVRRQHPGRGQWPAQGGRLRSERPRTAPWARQTVPGPQPAARPHRSTGRARPSAEPARGSVAAAPLSSPFLLRPGAVLSRLEQNAQARPGNERKPIAENGPRTRRCAPHAPAAFRLRHPDPRRPGLVPAREPAASPGGRSVGEPAKGGHRHHGLPTPSQWTHTMLKLLLAAPWTPRQKARHADRGCGLSWC